MKKNIFKTICKKCGGKCCKLNVMVSRKDCAKLKNKINSRHFRKYGKHILVHWGRCPFLNARTGCSLPERLKPFDCKIFPLTVMYEKTKIKIFLNKKCPYINEIPAKWIKETSIWLVKEFKIWKKEERKTYTELIKKHSSSKLTPLTQNS